MSSIGPNLDHLMPRADFAAQVSNSGPQIRDVIGASKSNNVGTYAFLRADDLAALPGLNETIAGSSLRYCNADGYSGNMATGTWRCLGRLYGTNNAQRTTLFLRIA